MNLSKFPFYLVLTLVLTSCASILNSKKQTVLLNYDKDSKVIADTEEVDGREINLSRDGKPKKITIQKDGYKDESRVVVQSRHSPLKILSYVPFGILAWIPPTFDVGEKSYNYHKEYTLSSRFKTIPEKTLNNKLIKLTKVAADIDEDKMLIREYSSYKDFVKNGDSKKAKVLKNSSSVKLENTIFPSLINDLLRDKGYVDTTANLFKYNYSNSVIIEGVINGFTINNVSTKINNYYIGFVFTDLNLSWEIKDYYNNLLFAEGITVTSGEFPIYSYTDQSEVSEAVNSSIVDAFEGGLLNFLNHDAVIEILNTETDEIDLDELVIQSSSRYAVELEDAMNATVTIKTTKGHGSGFFIDENGLLVTSYHVISGSESEITLILSNGLEFEGKMVRKSKNADVALIQINAPEVTTPLKISQNQPKVGSEIYLIGTPSASDLGQTISKGIISGIRKSQTANYVQTDASINTGNSGGPMIDKNGNVIGVVNSKLSGISTEGLGFVTPSNLVIESLNLQYSE